MRRVRPKRVRLLLDSGAYNVWNRRRKGQAVEPIDMGAYCDYLARNRDWLHGYVVLDEIPPIRPTVEQVEDAALQSYINLRAMKRAGLDLMPVYHQGEDISWLQRLIDDDRDVVVGATFVGQDVAELVHQATIAIVGEVPVRRLWHAVPAFPTLSEVWLRLLEADGRPEATA